MILLGWVDTLRMIWWWGSRGKDGKRIDKLPESTDTPGLKRLLLLNHDWADERLRDGSWGTVKSFITKAQRLSEGNGFHLLAASIDTLEKSTILPFQTKSVDHALVYIPLHCQAPYFVLYENAQCMNPMPGQIVGVSSPTESKHSVANFGDIQAVCLVLTLRREPEE